MAYLELDGITIPTAAGAAARQSIIEIGEPGRAFSGALQSGRRATKREWKLATPPLTTIDADALAALLLARGKLWPFNGDAYATDGFLAPTVTNVGYQGGLAVLDIVSGAYVPVDNVEAGAFLGAQSSIALDRTSGQNRLSAESASFDTTTGSAAAVDGATISRLATASIDTASGCLKVETSAAVNGVRGGVYLPATAPGGTRCTGSAYLRAFSGTPTVRVYLVDATNGVTGTAVTKTLSTTRWTRVACHVTTGFLVAALNLYVVEDTADAGVTFLADEACITDVDGASRWVAGGSSIAANGRLQVATASSSPFLGGLYAKAWTCNVWGWPSHANAAAVGTLLYAGANSYLVTTGPDLSLKLGANGVALSAVAALAMSRWSMITAVVYQGGDGTTYRELWVNAVRVANDSIGPGAADSMDLSTWTAVDVGSNGASGNYWPGSLRNLLFVQERLTSRWISALYNSGSGVAYGAWPQHRMTGDILEGGRPVTVVASLEGADGQEFANASGWQSGGQRLNFILREV